MICQVLCIISSYFYMFLCLHLPLYLFDLVARFFCLHTHTNKHTHTRTYIHTYIYKCMRKCVRVYVCVCVCVAVSVCSAHGVMASVVGNEHSDPKSKPGRGCLHIQVALIHLGKVWIQLLYLQLFVDLAFEPLSGNQSMRRKHLNSNVQILA